MARTNPSEILRRFEANDRQLISELTTLVIAICAKSKLPEHITPNDIAQEVLVCLFEKLRSNEFRGDSSVRTFVYRIAKNVCFTAYRDLKAAEYAAIDVDSLVDETAGADRELMAAETRLMAAKVMRMMSPKCRQLWRVMFWGRRNYRQAAEVLKVKEVTVRERMSRCRRQARELAVRIEKTGNRMASSPTKI